MERSELKVYRPNWYAADDMIHIKIPNLQNFKVEPLENFDENSLFDPDPKVLLDKGPMRGYSKWRDSNGELQWRECLILEYNENSKKFLISWLNNEKCKEVWRLK